MRNLLSLFLLVLLFSCREKDQEPIRTPFSSVDVEVIYNDSTSIRTLEILNDGSVAFAGSNGKYGLYDPNTKTWNTNLIKGDGINPEFRATAHTSTDFFMLSVANPALLYKTGDGGQMQLVYAEENEKVFYDSMKFWNDQEGIAMGDPTEECLSIIITRDGGNTWNKIPCSDLPKAREGEAAFAASNTNIAVKNNKAWIITGGMASRVFYTADKGKNWEVFETPLVQGTATRGGYSIDFYNEDIGFIIGGDYTKPEENNANKAISLDGGKTWSLIAEGKAPSYKSCVQFVPNSEGSQLVTIGFNGISYSKNQGKNWSQLSDEGFYAFRFLNDSTAYASGNGRIAKLKFH